MAFGLLRYGLCSKLGTPVKCLHGFVINVPRYRAAASRRPFINVIPSRWTSTKGASQQTKKSPSMSKVLRLYALAKPEKNKLACKSSRINRWPVLNVCIYVVVRFRRRMLSAGVQRRHHGDSVLVRAGRRHHLQVRCH